MTAAPVTRLFLVRHGATTLTAEDRFAGATDAPLSDIGREQARLLSERLKHAEIAAAYASPLARTMATARIIAGPHALEVEPRTELREISHGRWEQLTRHEVEAKFPDEAAAWEEDPYTFAPEGGESGLMVTARALPVLLQIVRAHPGGKVLVVSHKATLRVLTCALLGVDVNLFRVRIGMPVASVTVFEWKKAGPLLVRLGDVSHLPPHLAEAEGT